MTMQGSSALTSRVSLAIDGLGLSADEVGEVVEASGRSVQRWASGAAVPQRLNRDRLLELAYVAEALIGVLPKDHANVWIHSPNKMLGHDRPIQLIHEGRFKEVLDLIEGMADGVFV